MLVDLHPHSVLNHSNTKWKGPRGTEVAPAVCITLATTLIHLASSNRTVKGVYLQSPLVPAVFLSNSQVFVPMKSICTHTYFVYTHV